MERVQYYEINDLPIGYHVESIERVIKSFDKNKKYDDINDIIELNNIRKYIEKGIYPNYWSPEEISMSRQTSKLYMGIIGKFLGCISDKNIEKVFESVEICYKSSFWELFNDFNIYKKISPNMIKYILHKSENSIYDLLKYKKIVNYYGKTIREELLSNNFSAKLILDKYEVYHNHNIDNIYLPQELTLTDKEEIIRNYIDSPNPNPNYLRIIKNINSTNELSISDKTRLYAKRKLEEETNKIFESKSGFTMETIVGFSETQEEIIDTNITGNNCEVIYSQKWLKENKDYNTLLNNFIYIFRFVDMQMRITLISKIQEMGILEKNILMRSKKAYVTGSGFDRKDILSRLQLTAYYAELKRIDIRLEDVIEWFFKDYLVNEFGISGFNIKMPSENSLYLEKCTTILPQMESILKQFSMYVNDGDIDQELLQMSSNHLFFKDIPSLLNKKYVYGYGDEFKLATYYFFSDQCMLSYIEKVEDRYKNFYELLRNEKVNINDYREYLQNDLNWLINNHYIRIDNEGYIEIYDDKKIYILNDLCNNEFISYWKYPSEMRETIDIMELKNIINFESSLFSKPECDYFNYYLNRASFNNGLNLRNNYSHGTQPNGDEDEKTHESNYMIFLRLVILIIIKVNDEVCLNDEISKRKN